MCYGQDDEFLNTLTITFGSRELHMHVWVHGKIGSMVLDQTFRKVSPHMFQFANMVASLNYLVFLRITLIDISLTYNKQNTALYIHS